MTIYALNAKILAPSKYAGLSLTSLAVLSSRLYATATDGMVEFTGTDDEGTDIDAYVQTGKLSFGSMEEKRCARAYVKEQYANALVLSTIVDTVDADQEASEDTYTYSVPGRVGARQHAQAVRLRRDIRAVDWAFKIENVDGGGLVLRGLDVVPEFIEVDV